MTTRTAVTLLSGGLDSVTLAYDYLNRGYELHCLSFDYGQKHKKEVGVAAEIAEGLGARHDIILLERYVEAAEYPDPLASILGNSSLVSNTVVPDGHYAEESMRQTVVPNRNAIMLSIAYAVALADKASVVAFAAHSGDHAIYPDCRPEFVQALDTALHVGNQWKINDFTPQIVGPYLSRSKGDIAVLAHQLGVPISRTWSCYKGGDIHCGTCGTCYERREALRFAEEKNPLAWQDPTIYLDSTTEFPAP